MDNVNAENINITYSLNDREYSLERLTNFKDSEEFAKLMSEPTEYTPGELWVILFSLGGSVLIFLLWIFVDFAFLWWAFVVGVPVLLFLSFSAWAVFREFSRSPEERNAVLIIQNLPNSAKPEDTSAAHKITYLTSDGNRERCLSNYKIGRQIPTGRIGLLVKKYDRIIDFKQSAGF